MQSEDLRQMSTATLKELNFKRLSKFNSFRVAVRFFAFPPVSLTVIQSLTLSALLKFKNYFPLYIIENYVAMFKNKKSRLIFNKFLIDLSFFRTQSKHINSSWQMSNIKCFLNTNTDVFLNDTSL
jgi:hypothetical protein